MNTRFRFHGTMITCMGICSGTYTPSWTKGGRILAEEQNVKLAREQLYKEIWEISVTGVAKKYNASYNDLLKLCKEADIPVPASGYWTKLKYGKPVEQIPLPESSILEVELPSDNKLTRVRKVVTKESIAEDTDLDQDDEADEQKEVEDDDSSQDSSVPYRMVSGKYNTYNREKLYKEVWAKPVVKVAEQYGVSDVTIHKICKELNVPLPHPGYWAMIRAGAEVERPPLPKTKGPTETTGARTYEGVKANDTSRQPLSFLSETEREKVLRAAQEIKMPAENAQLHKKIAAYRNKRLSAGMISNDSLPRVYRILDALFRQVESLGGAIEDDLSMRIRKEHVRIEIVESQDKVPHVITKEEAKALLEYHDEKRRHSWASEPQIRKYDYVFNGRLRISVRQARYFRDKDKVNVESRLGEILIDLYEESEKLRLDRLAKEEEDRREAEAARRKEERRKRYNLEVDRTIALEHAALDYDTACRIRAYVKAVMDNHGSDEMNAETADWVEWATKKADWFDPTVARDDELFGEREHEKGLSEKALKKYGQYW